MDQLLVNQQTVKQRKSMKQIQKAALKKYGRGHGAVVKTRIGKLVSILGQEAAKQEAASITIPVLSQEQLLDRIRESHLTGMSGNNFPTIEKLENFLQSNREHRIFVVNGVECEPGLVHDEWLLNHYPDEIAGGIQIVCKALGIKQAVLAVKMDVQLERKGIQLCRVPARYPMGEEHVLLQQLFGISIDKAEIPAKQGYLVMNVQTVYQIFQLCNGTYEAGRYVTLADIDTGEAKVVFAKDGENIREVLETNFGKQRSKHAFAGIGILYAHPLGEEECFQGDISFAAVGTPSSISNENRCKKCGKCVRKCPMGVNVKEIVSRREQNPDADVTGLGLEKCIHCNSCTFFCKAEKNIADMLG